MSNAPNYFEYLRGRSQLGLAYRNCWLYPRLSRELKGETLDVGCGIGDMLRYRPQTKGVDIDPNAVSWCCSQGLDAVQMEVDCLPFADAVFDSVNLDNVLEHIAEPGPLLAQIHRVLKSGGRLLVCVPGKKGYATDPDHKIFYDENRLTETLAANGFMTTRLFNMPFRSIWLDENFRAYSLCGVFTRA